MMRMPSILMISLFVGLLLLESICSINVEINNDRRFIKSDAIQSDLIVNTEQGPVQGAYHPINKRIRQFLGIPYAKPPIDEHRFKPTKFPANSWVPHILNATRYGPSCPQPPPPHQIKLEQSEDCLFLNIWSPTLVTSQANDKDVKAKLHPVIVWIHGGSFLTGTGTFYDGSYLAAFESRPVVVVTINYRLGALGGFAHPELMKQDETTGNYQIMDQRAALIWVRKNIMQFQGDPEKITIAGQSAGGASTLIHYIRGYNMQELYFNQAIVQSGIIVSNQSLLIQTLDQAYDISKKLTQKLNCNNDDDPEMIIKCMQSKPMKDILDAQKVNTNMWTPVVDGSMITELFEDALKEGHFAKNVPIIVGSTRDDASMFFCPKYLNVTIDGLKQLISEFFGPSITDELLSFYNVTEEQYPRPLDAIIRMSSDFLFHCPTLRYASYLSKQQYNTFLYSWTYQMVPLQDNCLRIEHSSELPFLFPNLIPYFAPGYEMNDEEKLLLDTISRYWAYFTSSGDPNYPMSSRSPTSRSLKQCFFWKYYNDETQYDLKFSTTSEIQVRSRYYEQVCNFWEHHKGNSGPFLDILKATMQLN